MTNKSKEGQVRAAPEVPTSEEFTTALGRVTWLMTVSPEHKDKTAAWIEAHVAAALMFKQVRVYMKDKQPVAAVIWALVSPEVKAKLKTGVYSMALQDWRSGPEIMVVNCISPFAPAKQIADGFLRQAKEARTTSQNTVN